ncbi:MAG: AAA family ATPase, partial [Oscillospiraceae bacterium]
GLEDSAEEVLSEGVHQLLLTAEQGPVLTDAVVRALADQKSADLFVALRPDQQSAPFIDRLRFEQGFLVSAVQDADEGYLSGVFFAAAKAQKISLAKTVQFQTVLRDLRSMRGVRFSEYDFSALLSYAAKAHGKTPPLTTQQLLWHPFQSGRRSGAEALSALVGLDGVKQTLRRVPALAQLEKRQILAGRTVTPTCRNLAFSGKPGTCKSVTARIMAEILRECGVGSGVFVEAGREQLIGEYLGQTSPKIAALFAQARGGVLFIDEAGALLNTQQDSYADEAVNALVRHMELCPETMVIFATYPEETQSLLRSNPGLASRISRVIHFDAYSDEELYEILRYLAGKSDCQIDPAAQTVCTDFFHALKGQSGDSFGNGREARRLLVAAQEQLALRAMEDPSVPLDLLSCADFTAAAASLCADSVQKKRILGF